MAGLIFLWNRTGDGPPPSGSGGGGRNPSKKAPEFIDDFLANRNPDAENAAEMMRICMLALGAGIIR